MAKPVIYGSAAAIYFMKEDTLAKFQATDAAGRVHKRSSISHVYSHCVVIHLAAQPPSKRWPEGIPACSHAEWVGSDELAERKATRWRKEQDVEAVEVIEARHAAGET